MAFTKIENTDLNGIGVIGLPDQPGLSTAAMQAKFEETARSVVIPKHNGLIDELEDTTAAGNIGAVAPTGRTGNTVQAILDDISAFEKIESGGTTFTANGADTFKINAGSNVTITPLASPDKGIQISSAGGGGGGTGDMLMSDYDSDGSVKTAGGIKAYVSGAIAGKQDALTAGSGIDITSNTISLDMSMLTGSNLSYDNTVSGLMATNAQDALDELASGKQDTLTFDNVPTNGSNNPVKSDGIYDAISDVYGVMGENGAHNRINVPDQTATQSTITITVTNGVLEFSGANATPSAIWVAVPNVKVSKGTYVFKGLDLGQSSVSIIQLQKSDSTLVGQISLSESEAILNITEDASDYKLYIRIAPNTDATGVKAYPELVVPNDVAPFTPYAMTNRELTEKVTPDKEKVTLNISSTDVDFYFTKHNELVTVSVKHQSTFTLPISWENTVGTIPTKYRPSATEYCFFPVFGGDARLRVNADGTIDFCCTTASGVYLQGTGIYSLA